MNAIDSRIFSLEGEPTSPPSAFGTVALNLPAHREAPFDNVVFTVAQLLRVPMAMLAIVGPEQEVWLKSWVGPLAPTFTDDPAVALTVRDESDLVVIEDTRNDRRLPPDTLIAALPDIRFFAGVPLHNTLNRPVGALCVLDRQPRSTPDRQQTQLRLLAREAEDLLRSRE